MILNIIEGSNKTNEVFKVEVWLGLIIWAENGIICIYHNLALFPHIHINEKWNTIRVLHRRTTVFLEKADTVNGAQ